MEDKIEKIKIEEWIGKFDEEMTYFCKRINWKDSFLDNRAIVFMNDGFNIKQLKEILTK